MGDKQWETLNKTIEQEGYVWKGSAMMPSDSCEEWDGCCPSCDQGGYWVVWYQNEDKGTSAIAHQCHRCGHIWREDSFDRLPEDEER